MAKVERKVYSGKEGIEAARAAAEGKGANRVARGKALRAARDKRVKKVA